MKTISALIVDDNTAARKLLRSVLAGLGRRIMVFEAAGGPDALHQVKTGLYDIIFLDIEMPGMDGFEVLQEILAEVPEQFVVIVSANATIENVKKSVSLGGKGFIAKPYTIAKVTGVIDKYMQTGRAGF
ncbi:MAG: response regulator [Gammaproteobacteria bacterium]